MIDSYKMKEIRHYVANELYKCQKKTDNFYKQLENIHSAKKLDVDQSPQADSETAQIRKQMSVLNQKH